jgi:hypothetical protein
MGYKLVDRGGGTKSKLFVLIESTQFISHTHVDISLGESHLSNTFCLLGKFDTATPADWNIVNQFCLQ